MRVQSMGGLVGSARETLREVWRGAMARDPAARAIRAFAVMTLLPVALLVIGIALGGGWTAVALVFITAVIAGLDRFVAGAAPHVPQAQEFPAADKLSRVLVWTHFALLPLVIWAIAGDSGLSGWARLAVFLGAGLWFGQVSNSNAHELIHRADRRLFRLGVAVYVSLLYGHHVSAHRHVHHRFVASDDDPNSARAGEGFWDFLLRAWPQEFNAGHEIETSLRARLPARAGGKGRHPYVIYLGGAALALAIVTAVFGLGGLLVYLALCAYAQMQLILSDYVQHYGLARARLPGGKLEPVGVLHSWNAPKWASSALMLNAPLHSDHHAHPARPYPMLELPEGAPRLPYSLPAMAVIALVPPLWRRVMDPRLGRLARWKPGIAAAD